MLANRGRPAAMTLRRKNLTAAVTTKNAPFDVLPDPAKRACACLRRSALALIGYLVAGVTLLQPHFVFGKPNGPRLSRRRVGAQCSFDGEPCLAAELWRSAGSGC